MEVYLALNGYEIMAGIDEQKKLFLDLVAGNIDREELVRWIDEHTTDRTL